MTAFPKLPNWYAIVVFCQTFLLIKHTIYIWLFFNEYAGGFFVDDLTHSSVPHDFVTHHWNVVKEHRFSLKDTNTKFEAVQVCPVYARAV